MAHRQLEVLDAAEAQQEDPAFLEVLFKLDHLATRERRNAENLIILGGERPGRQWRNPVPLHAVVRGAIAETHNYSRVRVARFPEVRINGSVIADVIHLLAELFDNATSFSPPSSWVQAAGSIVGKGAAIEIVDQGLGMPAAELERVNELLRSAPDFSLMQLSSDSRLGLIVVSQLASRTGIKVRLTESDYGGIKAVVIVPLELLSAPTDEPTANAAVASPHSRSDFDIAPTQQLSPAERHWRAPPEHSPLTTRDGFSGSPFTDATTDEQPWAPIRNPSGDGAPAYEHPSIPDGRPPLPKRQRQESLAPELAGPLTAGGPALPNPAKSRSAEQARDLFSAIETGTRQGREVRPDIHNHQEGHQ
ncbi:sensor histidine kinase [Nocardia sp. CA-120079]|uniref:sensor histidine kinase n=1 Tax=Nocardia sp. CA-120079 TaxID=3239974 RepID=UPI003D95C864